MTIQLSNLKLALLKFVFHAWLTWCSYDNKYVIFHSLALFVHSIVESHSDWMYYFYCFIIISIMAGFEDDNFSLSGLTQQGHKLDVFCNFFS